LTLTATDLRSTSAEVMEAHWEPSHGFTVPNRGVYPWMWLWDCCFHSLVWDTLDDPRAVTELESVFTWQLPSGFVPHMGYQPDPAASVALWGARGHSTLTQPPMFGHAYRVLQDRGWPVDHLGERVRRGLDYLFERRRAANGLIRIAHPWESGSDDNPRWGSWQPQPFDRAGWHATKSALVRSLRVVDGAAEDNEAFAVSPASFNALVAWNAIEAGEALGDHRLLSRGRWLADRIDTVLWDEERGTWVDVDNRSGARSSVRTLDALLPALVTTDEGRRADALRQALDPDGFGLPYGPAGVHPGEQSFDPDGYARGASWPQLTYLLWQAARRAGMTEQARTLGTLLERGAARSGHAEHWNPETGAAGGARPQAWSGLASVPASVTLDRSAPRRSGAPRR
jgi:hypothetical protein